MAELAPSRTVSVSIHRPPGQIYEFVRNPQNLPRWATAFCRSVYRSDDGRWIVQTPQGPVTIRFVEGNGLGVLDHEVTLADGTEIYVPMRVVANPSGAGASGAEVIFTLFRGPEISEEAFDADLAMVERDLRMLKDVLEK